MTAGALGCRCGRGDSTVAGRHPQALDGLGQERDPGRKRSRCTLCGACHDAARGGAGAGQWVPAASCEGAGPAGPEGPFRGLRRGPRASLFASSHSHLPARGPIASEVDVVVRPEAVRIAPDSEVGALRATVSRATYMGSHTEYHFATPVGDLFAGGASRRRRCDAPCRTNEFTEPPIVSPHGGRRSQAPRKRR